MSDYRSILAKIDSRGWKAPRVRLRETPEDPGAKPKEIARHQTGRYEVVGEIGSGAVGEVLKAHDVDLGRDVAMKVLRAEHQGNAELIRRFVEEAQVGGQLQHPGIVPVYELGLQDWATSWGREVVIGGMLLASNRCSGVLISFLSTKRTVFS